jgi:hypothetical protein
MAQRLYGAGVGAEGVSPEALQPAPLPGSTFVTPVRRSGVGDNAMHLADALGNFNQSLLRFGSQMTRLENDPNSAANQDFANSLYGKSSDELAALSADGRYRPRIQQDALSSLLGVKAAETYQKDTQEWVGTEFDQNKGDLTSELAKRHKAALDALPNDAARASFYKSTESFNQSLINGDIKRRVDNATSQRNDAILTKNRQIIAEGDQKGWTPEQTAAAVMAAGKDDRAFIGLDGQTQNGILFQLATELANQGKTELVTAILNDKRGGVGPLSSTGDYGNKSLELIAHSQQIRTGLDAKQSLDGLNAVNGEVDKGEFTPDRVEFYKKQYPPLASRSADFWAGLVSQSANVADRNKKTAIDNITKAALVDQNAQEHSDALSRAVAVASKVGGANNIRDVDIPSKTGDGTETVTAKEQLDYVKAQLDADAENEVQTLVDGGASQADAQNQALSDKLVAYAMRGIVNDDWEKRLQSIPHEMIPVVANNGQIPPEVMQSVQTYQQLYAKHAEYVNRLVAGNQDAEDFFRMYRVGIEERHMTPDQAVKSAAQFVALPASTRSSTLFNGTDLDNAMSKVNPSFFGSFQKFPGWQPNEMDRATVKSIAQSYAGSGLNPTQALNRAAQDLADSSVSVNGRLVRSNDRSFPPDFVPVAQGMLDEYAKQHTDDPLIHSGSDLTLVSTGADQWFIVYKDSGAFVRDGGSITPQGMSAYRKIKDEEAVRQQAADAKAVDQYGPVKAWLRGIVGESKKDTLPPPAEARAYLSDAQRRKDLAAYVQGDATRNGIVRRQDNSGNDLWVNAKTDAVMVPTFSSWTDPMRSLNWVAAGKTAARGTNTTVPQRRGIAK